MRTAVSQGSLLRTLTVVTLALSAVASVLVRQVVEPAYGSVQAQAGNRVLAVYADVSGSTLDSDPDGILNSLLPAAAYASAAGRTFVATFADDVRPVQEVLAADEHALESLETQLAETPRGGATATAAAVAACLDLLEQSGAAPGSGCLTATDGRPEPEGEAQLKRIEYELAPRAKAAEYQLLFLGLLVNDPEGEAVFERVTQITSAPPYEAVNDPARLSEALLSLLARWRGASVETREIDVPAGGQASTRIIVDPREQRLDVLVARENPATNVLLIGPDGRTEVPRLALERLEVYSFETPVPGEYLVVASGAAAARLPVLALHEEGLSAQVVGDPAALPSGEEAELLVALTDDRARFSATDARASVTLVHLSGQRFTADAVPAGGGAYLSASFPPLPPGPYRVEASVTLRSGRQRTASGRAEVTAFPDLQLDAPDCLIQGRSNRVTVRAVVAGAPATLEQAAGTLIASREGIPLVSTGDGLLAAEVRPGPGTRLALSARVSGLYRGTATTRQGEPVTFAVCPPPPGLLSRAGSTVVTFWPQAVSVAVGLAYLSWWLTRPARSGWRPFERRWEGILDCGQGSAFVAELEDEPWTFPLRLLAPHLIPPSTIARCERLGLPLAQAQHALWLYERWSGLGCIVGRRIGPFILPVRHLVIPDGGEVELRPDSGITLGYERHDLSAEDDA